MYLKLVKQRPKLQHSLLKTMARSEYKSHNNYDELPLGDMRFLGDFMFENLYCSTKKRAQSQNDEPHPTGKNHYKNNQI